MFRLLQLLVRLEWPLRVARPLLGKWTPVFREQQIDPYPQYRSLQREHPVYFHPAFRAWILTRHADITDVLRDPRFSVDRTRANAIRGLNPYRELRPELMEAVKRSLLMIDPPDHTRLRGLVTRAFTPRRVEQLAGRVQEITDELLDEAEARPDFDFIRDVAYPLPVMVIAELLGAPTKDRALFKRWSDDIAAILDPITTDVPMKQVDVSYGEAAAYLRDLFAARRAEPRDDLISALVAAEADGDRLAEIELVAICMLLLGAGHETTTNLLGNAVLALLRHPDQRARLASEPGLMDAAVEELLRYDSPVQITDRVATEDLEIQGHRVRAGQVVGLVLGAANRDPDHFDDPDRLDLARQDNRHLAFGHGIHFCVGAALARLEARIVLRTFLDRYPGFTGDPDQRDYKRSMVLRGLQTFPLRLRGGG